MKLTLLLLALVAVTASVVYAAPQGDSTEIAIQEFLEKAMQQSDKENNEEQEMQAQLQSLLAEMEEDGEKEAKKQFWGHVIRYAAPHVIKYVRKRWGR